VTSSPSIDQFLFIQGKGGREEGGKEGRKRREEEEEEEREEVMKDPSDVFTF
jgi:hypothetical protein